MRRLFYNLVWWIAEVAAYMIVWLFLIPASIVLLPVVWVLSFFPQDETDEHDSYL